MSFAYDPTATTTYGIRILQQNNYYPSGLPIEYLSRQYPYQPATANSLRNNYQYNYKEWNDDLGLYLNDYGFRYFNPQLNQWHSIDPLAEDYYALSSYTYVANNPIKYTDPDGRWISEFEADPSEAMYELMAEDGGDPDCPECEGDMLPGVTITANRPFMKEDAESITTLFKALAEVKEREQAQFEANLAHKETGSCTPTNDELNLIPYEKLAAGILGITKLAAPFIVNGIKLTKKWPWKGAATATVLRTADCYKDALKIQKIVGGEIITISPIMAPALGAVKVGDDFVTDWIYHKAVKNGDMIYDRITGPSKMHIDEYKKLFQYPDYISFK